MKTLILSILLSIFIASPVLAENLTDLYREAKYNQIITTLEPLSLMQHTDESLYYLGLSYVKNKDYAKAKKIMQELKSRDSCFYAYKFEFDTDWEPVFKKDDMACAGMILSENKLAGHKIVKNQAGVFLYRNGVRQFLTDDVGVAKAGFVSDDKVYFEANVHRENIRNKVKMLFTYSGKDKRVLSAKVMGE